MQHGAIPAQQRSCRREFLSLEFHPVGSGNSCEKGRTSTGLMTGYYEPLLYGSRVRQPPYVHPIYGIPDNLLTIDLGELYPDLKGRRLRGKLDGRRVVPYDKRGAIQEKEAEMARWAIAWVSDPVDAFSCMYKVQAELCFPTEASCEWALRIKMAGDTTPSVSG